MLPGDFGGVWGNILDVELACAECGDTECPGKGGTTGDGFVLVEGAIESSTASVWSIESLLERNRGAIKDRGNKFFIALTGDLGGGIDIIHDRFNTEGCLHVGR